MLEVDHGEEVRVNSESSLFGGHFKVLFDEVHHLSSGFVLLLYFKILVSRILLHGVLEVLDCLLEIYDVVSCFFLAKRDAYLWREVGTEEDGVSIYLGECGESSESVYHI